MSVNKKTVRLAPQNICSGCTACQSACPKTAISMVVDKEGFLYPQIDESKCVLCGLCEKVCPSLNRGMPQGALAVYAAKAKDDELRMNSSSGGAFSLLAQQVIARGGVVYGAGFDHGDWHVVHKSAENESELDDLRGSKYVQSDIQGVYTSVKHNLIEGREVLFSGTPCQIAGLKAFLGLAGIDWSKLYLVDVVCHGVPSPLAWRKYLDVRLAKTDPGAIIRRIFSRCKNCSWKRYSLSLRFANDKEYLADLMTDTFLRGFLSELYNRPSCHQCAVREGRSGSDISLADYWRVHETFPELDDDRGTSLVLVRTEKGRTLLKTIESQMQMSLSTLADAVRTNPSIVKNVAANPRRRRFFKLLAKGKDFDWIVERLLRRSPWRRIASLVKRSLRRLLPR